MPKLLGVCCVLVLAVSCGGSTDGLGTSSTPELTTTTVEPTSSTELPESLTWSPCGFAECATLSVPLAHGDPSKSTIDLEVARLPARRAEDRIGVLLFNPGGPGVAGTEIIMDGASALFSRRLLDRFDVVSWDPRGVSEGAAADCVDDPEHMIVFDPTPETAEEEALIEATLGDFVAGCIERSGALLPYLSTVSTARDMDLLREALGEEQISYFGQSYGAALGSVYATLFPSRVRAMVLDGGYDPSAPLADWTVQQIEAEERTLTLVLERCAVDPSCRFHNDGDPFTAFDDLMARLDAEPLSVDDTEVGVGHALEAVYWGLAWEGSWPDLMRALAEAQDGSGRRLLDLAQSFTSSLERLHAIDCLDWPASAWEPSPTEVDAVLAAAPRLGPVQSFGRYPHVCRVWPAEPDPPPPITGAGAGPILVVGTTGDTQAAMESSRELAEHLEQGVLLVFEHTSHTAYWTSPDTLCVVQTVDTYLTGLEPPAHGSRCIYGDTQLHPPG